jgi:pimeloyl-ACP methyl ester carboxylesterase
MEVWYALRFAMYIGPEASSMEFSVHHALVTAEGASPSRLMLVLHGILGSGGNFRTIARRLVEKHPAWGFVLVDLRGHGLSQSPPPPSSVETAAEDLARLEAKLPVRVGGVMGHSFGGKVALAYAGLRGSDLDQVWVLDSGPGAHPVEVRKGGAEGVLRALEAMEFPLPSRERFMEILRGQGFSRAITEWLAMNVRRSEDGFRLRLDLKVIRALIEDYYARDLWPVIEGRTGGAPAIHVVLGGRSESVPEPDVARFKALAEAGAVHLHVLPNAGHWLHADDPEGLLSALGVIDEIDEIDES